MEITILACTSTEQPGWLAMRRELWPDSAPPAHLEEMARLLDQPERRAQFLARSGGGTPCGFVEAAIRTDYVNGTSSSPVLFLEGLYVAPSHRRLGIAARLVQAVAEWGMRRGCTEFASDVLLENELSQQVHCALGFQETERVVYYRKPLL
jgi:aminoglycoside 6'-N-acetyltransferase I